MTVPMLSYRPRNSTNAIILHDSHTPPSVIRGEDFLAVKARVMGLLNVGYHFVIDRDGQVHECRPHATVGSHCPGRNHDTVGVCLMGGSTEDGKPEDNIMAQQLLSLRTLVAGIRDLYGRVPILRHDEVQRLSDGRRCPCIHHGGQLRHEACRMIRDLAHLWEIAADMGLDLGGATVEKDEYNRRLAE